MSSSPISRSVRLRITTSGSTTVRGWVNRATNLSPTFTSSGTGTRTINLGSYGTISSIVIEYGGTISSDFLFTALAPDTQRRLKIQRRLSSNNTTETVYEESITSPSDPLELHEVLVHNDFLYLLKQEDIAGITTQTVLERYDLSETFPLSSSAVTEILRYSNTSDGATHLFVYEDAVHFMYNVPVFTQGIVIDALGSLNRIESDGSVTRLGNLWYEDDIPYRYSMVRPLVVGDDIHFVMGYGDAHGNLLTENSEASNADNFAHILRSHTLQYILSDTTFSGSHYDALAEIARLINATLEFRSGIIYLRDRTPFKAETDASTGLGTADIQIRNTTRILPESGYLRIGDEFIGYTGINTAQDTLTGIQRGVRSTPIADHAAGAACVFLTMFLGRMHWLGISSAKMKRHDFSMSFVIRTALRRFDIPTVSKNMENASILWMSGD